MWLLVSLDNLERMAVRKKQEIKIKNNPKERADHAYGNLSKDTPFTDTNMLQYIIKYTVSLYPIYSVLDIYLVGGKSRKYFKNNFDYEIIVVIKQDISEKILTNVANKLAGNNYLKGKLTTKYATNTAHVPKLSIVSIGQLDFIKNYESTHHHSDQNDDVYKAKYISVRLALLGIYDTNI
jgi:hypothetical protein